MKAAEIIAQIKELPPEEFEKVSAFILGEETPEMLAAIDEGLLSLEQNGGKIQTRADLEAMIRRAAYGEDPALQVALQRKQESISGLGTSRPYQEAIASARAALTRLNEDRPAQGS